MKYTYIYLITCMIGGASGASTNLPPNAKVAEFEYILPSHTPFVLIPETLKQIESETIRLKENLQHLPQLSDTLQQNAYGYHGGYFQSLEDLPLTPRWSMEITFPNYSKPEQAILIPAIDRRFDRLRSFGFPERFRILQVFEDGSTHIVKEWMDEDCPDPGRVPLTIEMPEPYSSRLRLEVYRGRSESGKESFALDEIFGVTENEIRNAIGVKANTEFKAQPYWSKNYLIDQKTSLGLPVGNPASGENITKGDFRAVFDPDFKGIRVVELDLGQNADIGWVAVFPAMPPEGIVIPGYGFPRKMELEIIRENPEGERGKTIQHKAWSFSGNPGNNVVRFPCFSRNGRWIRLTCGELRFHNNIKTFALGEILVYQYDQNTLVKNVALENLPATAAQQAGLLIDLKSNGRPVMHLLDWLHQIEQRDHMERHLAALNSGRHALRERWRGFWATVVVMSIALIVFAALATAVREALKRRAHSRRLREQINADLHDDIGSKVAAIALASNYVESNAGDPRVKRRGHRIQAIAQDMHQSLRDVLWVTDTQTDTLDQLVQKLHDCARIGIADERLELETTPIGSITSRPIGVNTKRDLLLFFKEALHNAAIHSNATTIKVTIQTDGKTMSLSIRDNGDGFEMPSANESLDTTVHHGLGTMQVRSKRLHGDLKISSEPGNGTDVELTILF